MRKKYIIRVILVFFAISVAFLLFSAYPASADTCKESLEPCNTPSGKHDKMVWEDLSRQFFSSI
jgi:hypothetical protein